MVVAAIGWEGTHTALVRDAQLDLGKGKSTGNVTSIDTRPFFPPAEVSPGTRPDSYYDNAGSFLGIGKAMGEAMIGLLKEGEMPAE